ncbi:hypothetical protein JW707_05180 [Candidatus Woesearchaeota archaeon]|nr:hypothetical protein [Candidatus Woesearchaeota archaeon]
MPAESDKISTEEIQKVMEEYKQKISTQLGTPLEEVRLRGAPSSIEYTQFKAELLPAHMTWYEKGCNLAEKLVKMQPKKEKAALMQESIEICHLNITPAGATSFAILVPLIFVILGIIQFILTGSLFFTVFFVFGGLLLMIPLQRYLSFLANGWRMKASNQMVLCIFYVVTYMRHTSNLELAIQFASDHLSPPLSLDLKKVIWNVETEKYESVKESLDMYLETWRKWNLEFIEAFHLIESSLYEGSEDRRLAMLDKSLDVILEETFEKMLHYAHNLKSPITMLHMMGVILPILGLVILPLVVSFMEGVKWYHIAVLYNIIFPVVVYWMGRNILATRPTGYGDTDISEVDPEIKKYRNLIIRLFGFEIKIPPLIISILVIGILFFIGLTPVLLHAIIPDPEFDINLGFGFNLLGYRESSIDPNRIIGPFGIGASVVSFAFPLAFGLGIGIYYRIKSRNVMKIREQSKKLESEFASALFQLGNRLGDGLPAEIAFSKVAEVMEDTVSGNFFNLVSTNIRKLGMGVQEAIFNPRTGALVKFPSNVIESSMKVLIESVKKGPKIAAQALMNVSRYIKEIHKVDERLKDLMADIISDMKSQIKFMTPAISGIVIGITSMISTILGSLGGQMQKLSQAEGASRISGVAGLFGDGIPTYLFQMVVGIYVVQIVYILTILSNGIENGADKLNERYDLGQNMIKSTILYCAIAMIVMVIFNIIASKIMVSTLSVG